MFSVTNTLAAFDDVLKYVQDNLPFFIIVAACLLAIIIVCTILIVSGKKAKKKAANEAATQTQEDSAPIIEAKTETEAASDVQATEAADPTSAEEASIQENEAANASEPTLSEPAEAAKEAQAPAEAAEPAKAEEPVFLIEAAPNAADEDESDPVAVAQIPEEEDADGAKNAYTGKWVVSKMAVVNEANEELDSAFFFQLKASNGESLITSEEYTTFRGAVQGIETFKSNIAKGNFKISISKKGKYIVKLLTNQGSLLTQGEKYSTRTQALSAIASIKRFAATAVRNEEVTVTNIPYEETSDPAEHSYDASKKGKWVIRKVIMESEKDASYCFELRASNGQVLFTSEEYSTVSGLKNGIKTHKNNIERGNIKAVITRNGDYIFKIFTGNGMLLCLGEHYKTKQLCLNAIESVKRFAQSAELNLNALFPEE